MIVQQKFYTADEFWEMAQRPDYADKRLELVKGELREMAPAGGEHGEVTGGIFGLIWNYVREHRLGRVTAAETGYVIYVDADGKDTVRGPDVGFVSSERAPEPFTEKYIPLVPDLAVEVVSPNDSADAVEEKVQEYLQHGVRLVWVIYPSTRTVTVHTPESIRRLTTDQALDGGDVLPGFAVPVSDIFPT